MKYRRAPWRERELRIERERVLSKAQRKLLIRLVFEHGVLRLVNPIWNGDETYLLITFVDGFQTPWLALYSPAIQKLIDAPCPQMVYGSAPKEIDWDIYDGKVFDE